MLVCNCRCQLAEPSRCVDRRPHWYEGVIFGTARYSATISGKSFVADRVYGKEHQPRRALIYMMNECLVRRQYLLPPRGSSISLMLFLLNEFYDDGASQTSILQARIAIEETSRAHLDNFTSI